MKDGKCRSCKFYEYDLELYPCYLCSVPKRKSRWREAR